MSDVPENDWDMVFKLFQSGNDDAFDSIFREFYPKLVGFARGYGGLQAEQAEDLIGDVFLWIWRYRGEIRVKSSFEAYLYGSVRNKLLNEKRNTKHRLDKLRSIGKGLTEEMLGTPPKADIQLETEELHRELARCIGALSDVQRLIITLKWSKEWSWDRIAEVVGITPASAQMTHTRALRMVRVILNGRIKC